MPHPEETAISLVLSAGLVVVAGLLFFWLWRERSQREPVRTEVDRNHFYRQDLRRGIVSLVLVVLALGIFVGSRLPPRLGAQTNPRFVLVWLGVFVLIASLLLLAMFDWLSTRLYARRQFRALTRERLEILREELRLHSSAGDGGRDRNGRAEGNPS